MAERGSTRGVQWGCKLGLLFHPHQCPSGGRWCVRADRHVGSAGEARSQRRHRPAKAADASPRARPLSLLLHFHQVRDSGLEFGLILECLTNAVS
jgi:hypothetical protein